MHKETLDHAKVISPSFLNKSGDGEAFAPNVANTVRDKYKPDPQLSDSGSKLLQMMQKNNSLPAEDEEDLFDAIQKMDRSGEYEVGQQNASPTQTDQQEKIGYSSPR